MGLTRRGRSRCRSASLARPRCAEVQADCGNIAERAALCQMRQARPGLGGRVCLLPGVGRTIRRQVEVSIAFAGGVVGSRLRADLGVMASHGVIWAFCRAPVGLLLAALAGVALLPADVAAQPDAEVGGISVRGGGFHAGDRVPLTIEIRNTGNAPLPAVPVALMVDHRHYADWNTSRELGPGRSATWRLTYVGGRGMHLLVATVDPFDDAPDANRANNSAFVNLGLGEERPPFAWMTLLLGLVFFAAGAVAGVLLRRPERRRSRRRPASAQGSAR